MLLVLSITITSVYSTGRNKIGIPDFKYTDSRETVLGKLDSHWCEVLLLNN